MKSQNYVGIDVSAKELVLQLQRDNTRMNCVTFDNTSAGHKKLIRYITKGGRSARVCVEATGVYHLDLAITLFKEKNTEIMVVNPRAIKHFASARMKRSKTDKVDAGIILEYLMIFDFQSWQPPADNILELRVLSRRLVQLKDEIVREKNRQHACDYNGNASRFIAEDIQANLSHIQERINLLQERAVRLVLSDVKLKKKYELLLSVKGIAQVSAVQILSELMCLSEDMSAEQWVAHAGLDPRGIESGSSLKKPKHISKMGNKYLRTALYMPAWVAVKHDPHVKAFYNKLSAVGKKPMQSVVAVMRKLLHAIWGMFKSDEQWQGERFYLIKLEEKTI